MQSGHSWARCDDREVNALAASSPQDEIPSPLRVVIVEDHPVLVRGLIDLIDGEHDLQVAASERTAAAAVDAVTRLQPDVVVIPWRLGGRFVATELARAVAATSAARTIVYTGFDHDSDLSPVIAAGATVVAKTSDDDHLLAVIRGSSTGTSGAPVNPGLTAREAQILSLVVDGLSNAEIADRLTISVTTVKTHVRAVLRKLGASSRRDLRPAGSLR